MSLEVRHVVREVVAASGTVERVPIAESATSVAAPGLCVAVALFVLASASDALQLDGRGTVPAEHGTVVVPTPSRAVGERVDERDEVILSVEDADALADLLETRPGPTPAMLELFRRA